MIVKLNGLLKNVRELNYRVDALEKNVLVLKKKLDDLSCGEVLVQDDDIQPTKTKDVSVPVHDNAVLQTRGVRKRASSCKRWSEEDDEKLREYRALKLTAKQMTKLLSGRSECAIAARASDRGLSRRYHRKA